MHGPCIELNSAARSVLLLRMNGNSATKEKRPVQGHPGRRSAGAAVVVVRPQQALVGVRRLRRAHRCVLAARSPVFMAELLGDMRETAAREVEVEDVFRALVQFIYTDAFDEY
ncbi:hypothetical protein PR202_gb28167 [Eleusine coracana subsp. coracana]|uniref:BTB domain-containing protein n=1 Tax=Eleusine coracana subsp. coracana TaxID=191504 RepID=A0AAV5FTM3_ELECO|nr:hypothetical protein PR202_gb28167 [Eleusine coracana subsp. coracana]